MSRRGPATAEPVAPERFAARVATGLPAPPQVVRLGVDGAVLTDTAAIADLVAATVAGTGRPVAVVARETFLRARSLRLEHGDDAEARWSDWYDDAALVREVLRPLAPGGSGRWTPSLLDPETDRPTREPARTCRPPAPPSCAAPGRRRSRTRGRPTWSGAARPRTRRTS